MIPRTAQTHDELLAAVFSDEPAPDIQAAVVVSHPGDECIGASWLLSRLFDRLSVFRLTNGETPDARDAITLTGLPADRCLSLGLEAGTLAKDLEALTWLVSASVKAVSPRMLVTHAVEGVNLDHDAVAFAVQMTALLLPRFGAASPALLEFQCHHDGVAAVHHDDAAPTWEQGVRVDFGPDSRRLKEEILRRQLGSASRIHTQCSRRRSTARRASPILSTPRSICSDAMGMPRPCASKSSEPTPHSLRGALRTAVSSRPLTSIVRISDSPLAAVDAVAPPRGRSRTSLAIECTIGGIRSFYSPSAVTCG